MPLPNQTIEGQFSASVDLTSSTSPQVVKAGTAAKTMAILNISISTDTAQSVKIVEDGGGTVIARKFLPANSVWSKTYSLVPRLITPAAGIKIVCGGSSGNVTVDVEGYLA